eukprot:GSChrysophyteH1.ASY1.ANO1.1253.1 assembled CDS
MSQGDRLKNSRKRTSAMFSARDDKQVPMVDTKNMASKKLAKLRGNYSLVQSVMAEAAREEAERQPLMLTGGDSSYSSKITSSSTGESIFDQKAETVVDFQSSGATLAITGSQAQKLTGVASAKSLPVPSWHAPWELSTIWDLAKCCAGSESACRLTLTGHIDTVRDMAVKCWDLETNTVIRNYHGHLSGVYSVALHPTLDVLVTGGRDCSARVWDLRTKKEIHVLSGHKDAVGAILTSSTWDLAAGKVLTTLTHHKKSVRSLVASPREKTFASASADGIRKWQTRDGKFLKNLSGQNAVINTMAINDDGVLFSGADNGSMYLWDYDTGYCFQKTATTAQPGSLEAENGIFASAFDHSSTRLITCEADKSIKIWKENTSATPDTHPVDLNAWIETRSQRRG